MTVSLLTVLWPPHWFVMGWLDMLPCPVCQQSIQERYFSIDSQLRRLRRVGHVLPCCRSSEMAEKEVHSVGSTSNSWSPSARMKKSWFVPCAVRSQHTRATVSCNACGGDCVSSQAQGQWLCGVFGEVVGKVQNLVVTQDRKFLQLREQMRH